jgi:hypothetical protein
MVNITNLSIQTPLYVRLRMVSSKHQALGYLVELIYTHGEALLSLSILF